MTVQALTPLTASRLWAMLNTDNGHRLMAVIEDADLSHKTEWLLSVFRDALPDKDFYDRSATHHLFAATCRRLCRFARTSLHWHRLRLNGTARFPFCFSVFHSPSAIQGLPTDMPLCAVIPGVPFNQGITLTDGQV